jgi:6-phosphogluconolactonase
MSERVRVMRLSAGIMVVAALSALTGCGNFFIPPDNGGGGGSTTGNIAYVANSANSTLAGFTVGTATLTAVSGSPLSLGYSPVAAVATPTNSFLYVAGPGAIYVYTINANGSLSASSTGAAVAAVTVAALDISPDGNWLFGLDATTTVVDQFQINTSTGALTVVAATPYAVASGSPVPRAIRVAPNGAFVFAALGTGGDVIFTFNTTTGALVSSLTLAPASTTTSDNGLAINSTTTALYIARSGTNGGVAAFSIGAGGALTSVTGSPFAAGTGTNNVVIDSTGKYVYAANRTDGTISGFAIGTTGGLSTLTGSPYASGTQVTSLGIDQSGKYLLAAAFGGSPDLSMYSFDAVTPGKLDLATSTATGTGTQGAIAVALTH